MRKRRIRPEFRISRAMQPDGMRFRIVHETLVRVRRLVNEGLSFS